MKPILKTTVKWALAVLLLPVAAAAEHVIFRDISVDRAMMNSALGDVVTLNLTLARPGDLTIAVVDRDGYVVRVLAHNAAAVGGANLYRWDGRNDAGAVVPNEAYSFRIEWRNGAERHVYFPADRPAQMIALDAGYYAARTATLTYTLPVASRVHVQAGVATPNPKTGAMEGPVLKTIVNREPRHAGRVAEPWNGLDESGMLDVAAMKDFVVAIAVTPLPENSVITYGSRGPTFAESAVHRTGESLLKERRSSQAHHAGLAVLDDTSPGMKIEPLNASWSAEDRAWRVRGDSVRLRITLTGPSAAAFSAHPGELQRYVDFQPAGRSKRPASSPAEIVVALPRGTAPTYVILNWRSEYGPVAANAVRIVRAAGAAAATPAGAH